MPAAAARAGGGAGVVAACSEEHQGQDDEEQDQGDHTVRLHGTAGSVVLKGLGKGPPGNGAEVEPVAVGVLAVANRDRPLITASACFGGGDFYAGVTAVGTASGLLPSGQFNAGVSTVGTSGGFAPGGQLFFHFSAHDLTSSIEARWGSASARMDSHSPMIVATVSGL